MSDLEAKFRVSLNGKDELANFFQRSEAGANKFASSVTDHFRRASEGIRDRAAEIGRDLLRLGGLGAGLGIAETAKEVLELRDQIAGLGATAGLSGDRMTELTERIHYVSRATNQLGTDVTSALQAFQDKGGNIDEGIKNLELYGRVATATRISMADVARAGADFGKLGVGQAAGFGIFAKQRDLLTVAPRLLSAFESGGIQGEAGLNRAVAFTRSVKSVLGDSEATRNAVESSFQAVGEKGDQLQAEGISVYDPKTHEARNRVDVILDIIKKAKGRQDILARIFGGRALKGLNPLAAEFRETGGFGSLEKFASEGGGSSTIDQMFDVNRGTSMAALKATHIGVEQAADQNLGGVFEGIARHPFLAGAGALLGGRALGALGGPLGRLVFGAGGEGGGALGRVLGSAGGVGAPVFVTNWPGGGGLGGGLGLGGVAAAEKTGETIAAKLGLLPRLLSSIAGGGTGAIVGGTLAGAAASLSALVAVTAPLNQKRQQIEDETRKQLEGHRRIQEENAERNALSDVDRTVRTFGHFGGRVTATQARDALRGYGSYGMNAQGVSSEFAAQQLKLRQLAAGERYGISEDVLGSEIEGGGFLLRSLMASNPELRKAKTGKERAKILERLASGNEAALTARDAPVVLPGAAPGSGGAAGPGFLDALLGRAQKASGIDLKEMAAVFRDVIGSPTFNITINGDQADVEGGTGTRAPTVRVARGQL